eukprot:8494013-Pyramimonas_sp.AAC.1
MFAPPWNIRKNRIASVCSICFRFLPSLYVLRRPPSRGRADPGATVHRIANKVHTAHAINGITSVTPEARLGSARQNGDRHSTT